MNTDAVFSEEMCWQPKDRKLQSHVT